MLQLLFQRFLVGRYGFDPLGRLLLTGGLVCLFVDFVFRYILGPYTWIPRLLGYLLLAYMLFRLLSRNLPARQGEARRFQFFLQRTSQSRGRLRQTWPRLKNGEWWREHRQYKFVRCPYCSARLRLPRGKGKLVITCPRCQHKMAGKS